MLLALWVGGAGDVAESPPDNGVAGLAVEPRAIPSGALFDEEQDRVDVGVVVVMPQGEPWEGLRKPLEDAARTQLGEHKWVHHVGVVRVRGAAAMDDGTLTKLVVEKLQADRVVVVRVFPSADGSTAKVLFTVLDDTGKPWGSVSSAAVLVPRQKRVSKGVERILGSGADPEPDSDDEEGGRRSGPTTRERRKEFERRALVVVRKKDDGGRVRVIVLRAGERLDDAALEELGVPSDAEPLDNRTPTGTLAGRGVGGALCAGSLGWPLLPLAGCAGLFSLLGGGGLLMSVVYNDARWLSDGIYCAACLSCMGIVPTVAVTVVAMAVTAIAGGVTLGVTALNAGDPVHPVERFATQYNLRLAAKLRLSRARLPRRYFPAR